MGSTCSLILAAGASEKTDVSGGGSQATGAFLLLNFDDLGSGQSGIPSCRF
jgi:hypothetical protein